MAKITYKKQAFLHETPVFLYHKQVILIAVI